MTFQPSVTVAPVNAQNKDALVKSMDSAMQDWTLRAARGECGWICADCCQGFSDGMPDACCHGNQWCTDIIRRDKTAAQKELKDGKL